MTLAERAHRRVCFIYNPAAGRGRARGLESRLTAATRALGWEGSVRTTACAGDEVALARAAQREGWPFVVAAGGDGTVHGVANGLLCDGPPTAMMGTLPIGSGNDFAHMLGMARGDLAQNVARMFRGRLRRFDVGRALGEYFINGMGVGFDAEVVRQLARPSRLRGFALYLAAVYRTFWGFRPATLEVHADTFRAELSLMMLEIAIGQRAGGGFQLTPHAAPDDGLFDICVIRAVGLGQFLRYLPRVVRGTHVALPPVTMLRAKRASVRAGVQPIAVHLDGELRESTEREIVAELVPGLLPVICGS